MIFFLQSNKLHFRLRPVAAVLLFVFVFNFASVSTVFAQANINPAITKADEVNLVNSGNKNFAGNMLVWGLNIILTFILVMLGKFAFLAGTFFDWAVIGAAISGFKNVAAVQAGWTISRDVANMFFIMILLIIAIATILRFESYSSKRLLSKLIIIALLINFSLSFSYMLIDFTNILGLQFYNALTINGTQPISQTILGGTKYQQLFAMELKAQTESSSLNWSWTGIGTVIGAVGGATLCYGGGFVTVALCSIGYALKGAVVGWLGGGLNTALKLGSGSSIQNASNDFLLLILPIIFAIPLIFVFLAGAIFMIIRTATLILVLVLAPLAFISYILPDTESVWKKWWHYLLSQSFFFPAFMFLLYISVMILRASNQAVLTGLLWTNYEYIYNMTTAVVLLLGSLIIARQMGIYGANTVIDYGKKAKQYAVGYSGAWAIRNTVGRAGEKLGQQEWVQRSYIGSRVAKSMAGSKGGMIFAKPGSSRSEVASKRAEFDVQATRTKAASEQVKDFMTYANTASKEKYVDDVLKDPKRLGEFMANSDDNAKAAFLRIARLKGGDGAEKVFNDAKRRSAMRGLKGDDLAEHFNRRDQTDDGRAEDLKAMESSQVADLLDSQSGDEQKLKAIMGTVASKFDPDRQERFYRAAMTGSSVDTAEKVYRHVPEQLRREFALRNTERTEAIYNKMKQSGSADADLIIDDIKKSGAEERFTRAGNPNRKNWMRRLGKHEELAEAELEEKEIKESREAQKEFNKTQAELNKIAIAQSKGGGGGAGEGSGGGGSTPPLSGGGSSTTPSSALPTDISSPSVKAGYSFKNEFEGKGDAEYAIAESERQLNKQGRINNINIRRAKRGLTPIEKDTSNKVVGEYEEAWRKHDERVNNVNTRRAQSGLTPIPDDISSESLKEYEEAWRKHDEQMKKENK